jgi:hypothetical protein
MSVLLSILDDGWEDNMLAGLSFNNFSTKDCPLANVQA